MEFEGCDVVCLLLFFLGAWYRIRVEKFAGCGNVAGVPIIGAYGDGGDCLVRV